MCDVFASGSNVCACWSSNTGITDERWLAEWVEFGIRELQTYLLKQARFSAYYERTRGLVAV